MYGLGVGSLLSDPGGRANEQPKHAAQRWRMGGRGAREGLGSLRSAGRVVGAAELRRNMERLRDVEGRRELIEDPSAVESFRPYPCMRGRSLCVFEKGHRGQEFARRHTAS